MFEKDIHRKEAKRPIQKKKISTLKKAKKPLEIKVRDQHSKKA